MSRISSLVGVVVVSFSASVVAAAPPQPASELIVSNISATGLSVSWSGASPEFRAIYKAASLPAAPTDGTLISEGTATSASVAGLTPNQRYFIAVYGKASGSSTYSSSAVSTSVITLNARTIDSNSRAGSGRFSNTSQGQLLFVDDPGNTDVLELFNGSTTTTVEPKGGGQNIDFDDIGMGSGATAGHVIAVWRRDQDDGHLSVDGGTPVLITGTNPIDAGVPMNLERLAIADGCVFTALECDTNVKNVYKIDPASGNGGDPLTNATATPGVVSRLVSSDCKAAWAFDDGSGSLKLQYTDGSPAVTADSGIGSGFFGVTPSIAHGKIVYVKAVGGVDQVFLYDTNATSPAPVQLTSYSDPTKFIDAPQTDGRHVVWFRNNNSNTAPEIDFAGGLTLASPVGSLSTEPEMQLNRGQLLWKDAAGNFRCETASSSAVLSLPATTYRPWLTDGFIGYGDTATAGAFLYAVTAPNDGQQPAAPMILQATAGATSISLAWDAVLGATSYHIYYATQPGVTKTNYTSLLGGTKITGITGASFTVAGLAPNQPYYFVVTTNDASGEGPESRQASAVTNGTLSWTSVGGLSSTAMFVAAADRTRPNAAFASGGNNTYATTNGGFTWTLLGGGIAGANVRAIAADTGKVFATTPSGSVYRSIDGGTSWTNILSAAGVGELNQSLAIDPAEPNTILAGDLQLSSFNGGLNDSYIVRSDDGGGTWFHLPQSSQPAGADVRAYSLAFDPAHSSTLYAAGTGTPNVAKSVAGGAGWSDAAEPAPGNSAGYVYSVAVDPTNSQVVYAGVQSAFGSGSKGVWKSANGGVTWTAINNGLTGPPAVRSLVIDPADHNIIHAGTESGYFYSIDGGATWTAANGGLPDSSAQFIYALAMTQSHRLIAATAAGLYLLNLHAGGAPTLDSVSPPAGPVSGGNSVSISGHGFETGATVSFGGVAATSVIVNSAVSITAVTPAHSAGKVNVVVTNGDGQSATLPNGYTYGAATGDFNGDGKTDLVLRNYSTGQDALWLMNGTALMSIVDLPALPNTNYRFEGTADFNGDGKNDIVLRNMSTGQDALWLMNGTSLSSIVDLPALTNTNYHFQGTGDFNKDGKPDIILRNFSTGQDALWLMNGTSLNQIVDLPALPNTSYQFAGAADFDGDGSVDIVLRNYSTGQNALWLMNGTSLKAIVDLPALPNTNYRIDAVGDLNGDGKPDLVWRNYSTGQNAVWLMNGTSLNQIVDLPALPNTSYQFGGPR